ncbi:hypothetical protein [Prosthecobacter sp.]|uniref:hypothetical protein n=1 Tax=Prosthecobacter sp. TaxID=1965333 RepID=UPI003784DA6E
MKAHPTFTLLALLGGLSLSSCISIVSHDKPTTTTVTRETVPTPSGMSQTTQTTTTRSRY